MITINYKLNILFLITYVFISASCQEGLAPLNEKTEITVTKFSGRIIFKGGKSRFPDSSNCYGINVAAFKKFPTDSSGIFSEFLKGNLLLNNEHIDYPADSSVFTFSIEEPPINFEYIVVAMQTDSSNINAQKAIGVFTLTGENTQPSALLIEKGKSYDIRIEVDFDNLPPQPF